MVLLVSFIQAALEWAVYSAGLFGEDPAAAALLKPLTLAWYLSIAALITATVHQDPIPGADQDWLIRPIQRRSLLLSKLMFLAVVISVPMFAANLFDALANGFAPAASLTAALWKESFVFACFVMPVMALSALARNTAELVIISAGLLLAFAASVTLSALFRGADWCPTCNSGIAWLQHVVQHLGIVAGAAVILGLQYFRRRFNLARWFALAGAVVLVFAQLPWHAAFSIEQRITAGAGTTTFNLTLADPVLTAAAASEAKPPGAPTNGRLSQTLEFWRRRLPGRGGPVTIELPISVEGVAADELLLADRVEVSLTDASDRLLYHGDNAGALAARLSPRAGASPQASSMSYQSIEVPGREYRKAQPLARHLQIKLSLSLMKIDAEFKLDARDGNLRAAEVGRCATLADRNAIYLRCKTIDKTPFCYSASWQAADGSEQPAIFRCVPDYRRHLPAFMEIMGFYGIDLPLHEKNSDPTLSRDYDLRGAHVKFRIYREAGHYTRLLKSDASLALLNFLPEKTLAHDQ